MSAQPRKKSGQFASETPRDPFALYELVRIVATRAAALGNAAAGAGAIPVLPKQVTMEAFDKAAGAMEAEPDHGTIPKARVICKMLPDRDGKSFSWPALLELCFDERSIERVHQERRGSADDRYIAEPHIYYALNRIARMKKVPTLSGIEYSTTRELMVRADDRRPNGGHLARLLPTLGQIQFFITKRYEKQLKELAPPPPAPLVELAVEDASPAAAADSSGTEPAAEPEAPFEPEPSTIWSIALEIAELDPQPKHPQVTRDRVPALEAALRFYEIIGRLPSEPKLRAFARDFNFALEDVKERSWPNDVLPEVIAEIRRRELPEPPPYDPRTHRLTWEVPDVSPWPDDPPHRPKNFYTRAMVLTVIADFRDWLPRGEAPTKPLYQQFSRDDPDKPSTQVIEDHGGLDALFEELNSPDALELAHRELNPTAAELADLQEKQLEKKLQHPTPQGILRVITERGEVGSRNIATEIGVEPGTVNNWLPLLIEAGKIETTTPSRVAKNVKYCLKGHAPSPEESKLRKLRKQVEGERCQAVLKIITERAEVTSEELSEELGSRREVVAKWLRPLKELGHIEQIDDRTGGKRRTYYRLAPTGSPPIKVSPPSPTR